MAVALVGVELATAAALKRTLTPAVQTRLASLW